MERDIHCWEEAPLSGVFGWVVVLNQSRLPDWEGCRVAVQESVLVFAKYTLENLRVMSIMSEKDNRVMEQIWQNVNNREIWVIRMQEFFVPFVFLRFTYFWLRWDFIATLGLSHIVVGRLLIAVASPVAEQGSRQTGFSCCGARAQQFQLMGSRAHDQQLWCTGMWDLPGSGIEPVSPALVGGFFITEPPGKPLCTVLKTFL